jgi:hypothetical protein
MKQFGIALELLAVASSVLSAPMAIAVNSVAQREGWDSCCKEGVAEAKRSEATTDDIFYPQREGWGTINPAVTDANDAGRVFE